jgi:hypothetical protein
MQQVILAEVDTYSEYGLASLACNAFSETIILGFIEFLIHCYTSSYSISSDQKTHFMLGTSGSHL